MSLPYVLAQGILVGKVMSDDKTNWKVLIPYTCQFFIGNVRQKLGMFLSVLIFQCQFLIGNVRPEDVSDDATTSEKTACVNSS